LQQNEDFLIQIKLDNAEDLTTAHIDGEWRLMELLSSYGALIIKVGLRAVPEIILRGVGGNFF